MSRRTRSFETKREYVASLLREMIVSGEMSPGTRIRQEHLAAELGLSATPIREAMQQLETEGFVTITPHVGAEVSQVNRDGLEEVYDVRALLEGYLAREATAHMGASELEELARMHRQFVVATEQGRLTGARRANYRVHRLIWDAAQRPLTLGIVNSLWAKFPWNALPDIPGREERSVKEHDEILRAFEAGDPDWAERAMRAHLMSAKQDVETSVRQGDRSAHKARQRVRRQSNAISAVGSNRQPDHQRTEI